MDSNDKRFLILAGLFFSSVLGAQPNSNYLKEKEDGGEVKYYHVEDCDKDGSSVGARVASAGCGVAETRTLAIRSERNLVGPDFLQRRCTETCQYYHEAGLGTNPLLRNSNVVMGSVHELGLYIAEVLHAPLLPTQFLGFAESLQRLEETPGIKIAMSDYGVHDKFWVWCKVGRRQDVPVAYLEVLRKSQNLFLVRSTETEGAESFIGEYNGCYIHSSTLTTGNEFTRNIVGQLPLRAIPERDRLALRQHEWGVPDQTIKVLQNVWVNVLRKSSRNFHVVEGGTVQLFCALPSIWEEYLVANQRPIQGITLNSYYVAHPSYERRYNLIPFHFYRFKNAREEWVPYDSRIREMVASHWQNNSPFIVTSFVNNIGSGGGEFSDVLEIQRFLQESGLWADNANIDQYFCVGFDCTGYVCESVDGERLDDIPSTKVRKWLMARRLELADVMMQPLRVGVVVALAASLGVLRPTKSKL